MFAARRLVKKGFTLVEILIVVIILGILAAIVIPQFTSASDDARKNSLTSQVQTLRSQIELYKLQHTTNGAELFATATTPVTQWQELTNPTGKAEGKLVIAASDTKCGPYLQTVPENSLNGFKTVQVTTAAIADDTTFDPSDTAGFVYDPFTGKFYATNKDCSKLYNGNN